MRASYTVLGVLIGCALTAGCDTSERSDPQGPSSTDCAGLADDCSHVVDVRGAHTHFSVRVPATWGIGSVTEDAVCDSGSYRFEDLTEARERLRVEAVPTDCEAAGSNSSIGNGSHGTYRTIDDVPEPEEVASVQTPVGGAVVFTQEYYECTNSCERWDEPVAIITLDAPVRPGYPTLVLRGERDSLSRTELEEILAALEEPYPPPLSNRS